MPAFWALRMTGTRGLSSRGGRKIASTPWAIMLLTSEACLAAEPAASVEAAVEAATGIGYPVMVKAAAGGGGMGMSVAADEAALRAEYDKVRAFALYESEVRPAPHPRSPESLRARAATWGSVAGCGAAEAFRIVRELEFGG